MALPTLKDLSKDDLLGLCRAAGLDSILTEKEVAAEVISHWMDQRDAIVKRVNAARGPRAKRLTNKKEEVDHA